MRRRLIALLFLMIFFSGCAANRLAIRYPESAIHHAPTADGLYVGLVHLPPKGTPRNAPPLILCHGFTSTTATFDLGNGQGLGVYLQARGYDVWMLNLRGRRYSAMPQPGVNDMTYGWTFDDYVQYDVPAAIDYVKGRTGASKVTWIGHSMGGLVAYAYLGQPGNEGIDKLVTIGSPVKFTPVDKTTGLSFTLADIYVEKDKPILTDVLSRSFAGTVARNREIGISVINPDNFSADATARYVANSVPNISGSVTLQFREWAKNDTWESLDHRIDYRANLGNIRIPAMVVCGKLDNVAPTWSVYPAYHRLGSADKTFLLLGQANGTREDHGHGGIVLGNWAITEVYEPLEKWLAAHQ